MTPHLILPGPIPLAQKIFGFHIGIASIIDPYYYYGIITSPGWEAGVPEMPVQGQLGWRVMCSPPLKTWTICIFLWYRAPGGSYVRTEVNRGCSPCMAPARWPLLISPKDHGFCIKSTEELITVPPPQYCTPSSYCTPRSCFFCRQRKLWPILQRNLCAPHIVPPTSFPPPGFFLDQKVGYNMGIWGGGMVSRDYSNWDIGRPGWVLSGQSQGNLPWLRTP